MKRFIFIVAYLLSPVIPIAVTMAAIGGGFDTYSFSVMLGMLAFILLCNQLILASKPRFAVAALGLKGLLSFHGSVPAIILAIAVAHRMLKAVSGFDLQTVQATVGLVVLLVFFIASVAAFAFLANIPGTLGASLRSLRAWADKTFKMSYKLARTLHSITVLALLALAVHVGMASSVSLMVNPFVAAWLAIWLLVSLGLYARYRLRGRPAPTLATVDKNSKKP